MTRRDFALIADSIRDELTALAESDLSREDTIRRTRAIGNLARRLARTLRVTNSRFDDRRFLEACGVPTAE